MWRGGGGVRWPATRTHHGGMRRPCMWACSDTRPACGRIPRYWNTLHKSGPPGWLPASCLKPHLLAASRTQPRWTRPCGRRSQSPPCPLRMLLRIPDRRGSGRHAGCPQTRSRRGTSAGCSQLQSMRVRTCMHRWCCTDRDQSTHWLCMRAARGTIYGGLQ
jgi:hypothetical protein